MPQTKSDKQLVYLTVPAYITSQDFKVPLVSVGLQDIKFALEALLLASVLTRENFKVKIFNFVSE